MKAWKVSLAAALLFLPSCAAMAATTTIVQGQVPAYYPAPQSYQQYNPFMYGAPQSNVQGQVQQSMQNLLPVPGQAGQMQQQQPTTYHYKGRDLKGSISQEELPQRIFHNIPMHIY